jgi:cell division GTPase FtsZ
MAEVNEIAKLVAETADRDARIIFGAYYDRNLKPNQLKVTIVATGLNGTPGTALFGGADHFEPRPTPMFTRAAGSPTPGASASNDDKNMPTNLKNDMFLKKNPAKNSAEAKNIFDGIGIGKPPTFSSLPPKDEKKDKEKDDDSWDFPSFLRKRKR